MIRVQHSVWLRAHRNCKRVAESIPQSLRSHSTSTKFYGLAMFPYPSGSLHIGHLRVYTISDVVSRFKKMRRVDTVVHPMGWDAFGLPAENAAIERGIDPETWTKHNIAVMKDQMALMGADFDWSREVVTCDPEYYRWTQKLFLILYEHGLAYRRHAEVNWDPVEGTVLANEQVDAQGRSWRSGAIVEKRMLDQWFLKITDYASELVADLDLLDQWPQNVKTMQRNWIGLSHGVDIEFKTVDAQESVTVFTTRPDTIFGAQFVALALDHDLVKKLAVTDVDLQAFVTAMSAMDPDTSRESKKGYKLKTTLQHPLTQEPLPIFVANYVISGYGYGAVMGCPGHDERDAQFWAQNMPGHAVIKVVDEDTGLMNANSNWPGLTVTQAGAKASEMLESSGLGSRSSHMKLRDWLISRQRFWGAPIPMVHCDNCGIVPVPDDQLPVRLPQNLREPLADNQEFLDTSCPKCHGPARRDSDTMDTFMDSSWYMFRYTDPHNHKTIFDHDKASQLLPVDTYIGGVEHAILHLLYARFISKFLHRAGYWDGGSLRGEPIRRLVTQGMVHGKTVVDPDTHRFLKPSEIVGGSQPMVKATGKLAQVTFEKMSKSKYNGADPAECIAKHGADATRAHILFQAPVAEVLNWDENKIVGIKRWLARVEQVVTKLRAVNVGDDVVWPESLAEISVWNDVQDKLQSITHALEETLAMNTLISDYMKLTRIVERCTSTDIRPKFAAALVRDLIKVIAPVVPETATKLWGELDQVFTQRWPETLDKVEIATKNTFSVVINGKPRLRLELNPDLPQEAVMEILQSDPVFCKWTEGKTVTRMLMPKGRSIISVICA